MPFHVGSADMDMLNRMKLYDWYDFDRVKKTRVLVAGAGALGNEAGKNLVLSGFERITIVDMDRIVHSNLSRCVLFRKEDADSGAYKARVLAERLEELNPGASVDYHIAKIQEIGENAFKEYDMVIGCLDNIEARLYVNSHIYYHRVPYIDGATHGMVGKVQVVFPPETSCLQCGMNLTHAKVMGRRFSCTGKDVKYFEPNMPSDINTTSVIAAVQVREALKISHGMQNYIKNIFYYDGMRNFSSVLELPINPNCPNHD